VFSKADNICRSAADKATNKAIAKANKQLAKAGNFGQQVVATCK